MRVNIGWVLATCTLALAVLASSEASAAKKKKKPLTPHQQIVKAYDRNHDGKLGRYEKAAAMPAIAALREQRALQRNAAVLQGIQ